MDKLKIVEFHDSRGIDGPVEGSSFLVADGMFKRSVRTKSLRGWPRESYSEASKRRIDKNGKEIPGKDIIHFISYDSDNKSYLLESAVRIGKGDQRQESSMTVEEIKSELPDGPESMVKIVEILASRLAYTNEGFPEKPVYNLEPVNQPIEPSDVLSPCRRAACLNTE